MNLGIGLPTASAVAQLCPQCGLCCNGTLFADVKLKQNDNPAHLTALGLVLHRRGTRLRLPQPCPAFADHLCRVYPDRPMRCRSFECRLLHRVQSGQITVRSALHRIRLALKQLRAVESLLHKAGSNAAKGPLTHRYRRVMARPLDLSNPNTADLGGEILVAMGRLMHRLHREFL